MKKGSLNGGYVGLLVLFLSVSFIIFFILRTDIFSGNRNGKSMIQQDREAIERAEAVRVKVEQNNQQAGEE